MTIKVQNLSDLQDRRIMMEKKLPPYGYAFVILVGIFMLFLVVWSTHTNRIYVSQNAGTVQASNKTYIMSSYSGSITEMYISEGSYVNEGDLVAHIKSTDIDMQQDNLESQLKIYQTQLDQYNKLLQCVQDDTNYFSETNPEDQPYYYQYETYKSQVSQKTFDATAYQAAGYSDAQIKTMMEQSQSEVEALYYSTMQSISQSITSAQSNVDNVQAQLDALNTGANDYYIYAPTSGVIHMDTPYKEGMVLSAGSPLATVASENDDLEIVAMVTVNDRPLLHVGDPCKIAITGLSEYSYGTLTGTVTAIDSDVTASSNASYYKMTIKPDALCGEPQRRQGGSFQRHERYCPRGVRSGHLFRVRNGSPGRSVPLNRSCADCQPPLYHPKRYTYYEINRKKTGRLCGSALPAGLRHSCVCGRSKPCLRPCPERRCHAVGSGRACRKH